MRPRVFPAEDGHLEFHRLGASHASMRPRVFPAEDRAETAGGSAPTSGFNEAAGIPRGRPGASARDVRPRPASMRPRVFPAEDIRVRGGSCRPVAASMRPRVFPAEDPQPRMRSEGTVPASMRPRVFPAEDGDCVVRAVAIVRLQ